MSARKQNPIRRFAEHPPVPPYGDVRFSTELLDDQSGTVVVSHGPVQAKLRAAGLSLPYPSGLKRLVAQHPDVELVIAEQAPRGLQKAADELGLNLLDLKGHGKIVAPGLVYAVEPRPALHGPRTSSPFAPKASRVVRALLSRPEEPSRLSDLAALTELNPGNVHRVLAALIEQGVVERDEDNYVVSDPGSLLEAWALQAPAAKDAVVVPYEGDSASAAVADIVRQVDGEAVISGELAAEDLAPYLPAQSAIVHLLSPPAFHTLGLGTAEMSLADRLRAAVSPPPNHLLVDIADVGVGAFGCVRDGVRLASPQQIYVDLARSRGRAWEAAQHLRREVLGY